MKGIKTTLLSLLLIFPGVAGTDRLAHAAQESQDKDPNLANTIDSLILRSRQMWSVSLDSAYLAARGAADLAEELNDPKRKASAMNQLGASYQMASNYYRATESYLEALEIGQKLKDSSLIARAYNNMGLVHYRMKEFREAVDYMWKAHNTFLQTGDTLQLANIHLNIGALYHEQAHYDSAKFHFNKSLDLARMLNHKTLELWAMNNIADVYGREGNLLKALELLEYVLNEGIRNMDLRLQAIAHLSIGQVYLANNVPSPSLEHLEKALDFCEQTGESEIYSQVLNSMSDYYKQSGKYREAYDYLSRYHHLVDRVFSDENAIRLAQLKYQTEYERGLMTQEGLEQANKMQTIQLKRQQAVRNFLIIIIVTIVVLGLTIIYSISRRQKIKRQSFEIIEKKNKELEDANEKLRKSEQSLRELNLTKDKFFSIIGHDLKSPMNALMGFSELLAGDISVYSEEEIAKYAAVIHKSAENINQLVDNILEWSRTQTGNIEFNPEPFNLALVVNHIIETNKLQAESKDLKTFNKVAPDAEIFADKNLISTVIRNLLSNAIKFTPKNGTIEIGYNSEEASFRLWVKDTGTGIPEEMREDIFRLSTARTRQGTRGERGSGLGLLLCKEFVEMHNGTISIESKVNEGSTFVIDIPNNN